MFLFYFFEAINFVKVITAANNTPAIASDEPWLGYFMRKNCEKEYCRGYEPIAETYRSYYPAYFFIFACIVVFFEMLFH